MDVGQISLWVSLASFALAAGGFIVAIASASYSRRQARAAEAHLKRKGPVFELIRHPTTREDGWTLGSYTIRNFESVRIKWDRFEVNNRHVKIISVEDSYEDDGFGNLVMPEIFPVEKAKNGLEIDAYLAAYSIHDARKNSFGVRFAFHGPLKAKDVKHIWRWADE